MSFITYILEAIFNAIKMFVLVILPFGALTIMLQFFSQQIGGKISRVIGYRNYIYLTSVGVAIHELGHAFFCVLFGHKIKALVPFTLNKGECLGYVSHSYNPGNLYHRIGNFFIGTGPIWAGFSSVVLLSEILLPPEIFSLSIEKEINPINFIYGIFNPIFWINPLSYIWIYLTVSITLHISLSKPDIKGALDGAIAIFVVVLLLNLLFSWYVCISDVIIAISTKIFCFFAPVMLIILLTLLITSCVFQKKS